MSPVTLQGLYVITDDILCGDQVVTRVAEAIEGGAAIVQYRSKQGSADDRRQQATGILAVCRQAGVPLLVNDDPELAQAIGADGVHLGQSDARLGDARQRLGEAAIIGVTCHASLALAQQAEAAGADYVAFGRFFASNTKPGAPPASIEIIRQAKCSLGIPVCAIGGITPENAPALLDAGADMLAVIHGVFGQPDVKDAAGRYSRLFAGE